MPDLDSKSAEYVRRSERARADIGTWPAWMQHNLRPPTEVVTERRPPHPLADHPVTRNTLLAGNQEWTAKLERLREKTAGDTNAEREARAVIDTQLSEARDAAEWLEAEKREAWGNR